VNTPHRIFVLLLLIGVCCFAQDRGTISGTVTDISGSAVPDATITVKNPATGLTQTAKTSDQGTFSLPYLFRARNAW